MQDILLKRRRRGFIGREAECAEFQENLRRSPTDERHRFLFHVHGNAGVGKTFLVGELERIAREQGALTGRLDESVSSLPEALGSLSTSFALQGQHFRELDRLLATYQERRHQAELGSPNPLPDTVGPGQPSPGSMVAARASLMALGLVPGIGCFAGAFDPTALAAGADRLRDGLARLRSHEDVQLVLSPDRVLTPLFLQGLVDAADRVPWVVLFFDTYEQTAPFLDGWLHDVVTTTRYGLLPARVVLVTAGQRALDRARWGDVSDFVEDVPLGPFTESEARRLLASKGVVSEPVVAEVLRLTGRLPVLVSTLAASCPTDPDTVEDPTVTAVERFLKWEQEPIRRAAALSGALPRRLDADMLQVAVGCSDAEAATLFGWLRCLPFVRDHRDGVHYHDVVRSQMLRLQRRHAPRNWVDRHTQIADAVGRWAAHCELDLAPDVLWTVEEWRDLRLAESYHRLCARPSSALPAVLHNIVSACEAGEGVARQWAQMLRDVGVDAEASTIQTWGDDLLAALDTVGLVGLISVLLDRAPFSIQERVAALAERARNRRKDGEFRGALTDYSTALFLVPDYEPAYIGRALTRAELGDYHAAIDDLNRADQLIPDKIRTIRMRGDYYRILGQFQESLTDLDRALEIDPSDHASWTSRGATLDRIGDVEAALADINRALELKPDSVRALVYRARARTYRREERDLALSDLNRAVELNPDSPWVYFRRGETLRILGNSERAMDDFDRAIELDSSYSRAYAGRGAALGILRRYSAALADLDRALEMFPLDEWTLARRSWVHCMLGNYDHALNDADQALALGPGDASTLMHRAQALHGMGRFEEARTDLEATIDQGFGHADTWSPWCRADFCLSIGSLEQARVDLQFFVDRGQHGSVIHARHVLAVIQLLKGRVGQAVADLEQLLVASMEECGVLESACLAFRLARRESAARRAAERLRTSDDAAGLFNLALTAQTCQSAWAARPLWYASERATYSADLSIEMQEFRDSVMHAALGQWSALDLNLHRLLMRPCRWDVLARLCVTLNDLLQSVGQDCTLLSPRIAAVVTARDAIQNRYA
ncbi:tetratricopeptide repeat protein [Streptomyces xylophagus]|uniref:tetratricopeptide repeat protein n=1 Tax=Streptomyces xylophagus TaxID=285514 RepID=UPI00131CB69C|nr:tetratricopeptide repeat protein [Streptomyces xylophagus]